MRMKSPKTCTNSTTSIVFFVFYNAMEVNGMNWSAKKSPCIPRTANTRSTSRWISPIDQPYTERNDPRHPWSLRPSPNESVPVESVSRHFALLYSIDSLVFHIIYSTCFRINTMDWWKEKGEFSRCWTKEHRAGNNYFSLICFFPLIVFSSIPTRLRMSASFFTMPSFTSFVRRLSVFGRNFWINSVKVMWCFWERSARTFSSVIVSLDESRKIDRWDREMSLTSDSMMPKRNLAMTSLWIWLRAFLRHELSYDLSLKEELDCREAEERLRAGQTCFNLFRWNRLSIDWTLKDRTIGLKRFARSIRHTAIGSIVSLSGSSESSESSSSELDSISKKQITGSSQIGRAPVQVLTFADRIVFQQFAHIGQVVRAGPFIIVFIVILWMEVLDHALAVRTYAYRRREYYHHHQSQFRPHCHPSVRVSWRYLDEISSLRRYLEVPGLDKSRDRLVQTFHFVFCRWFDRIHI